MKMQIVSKKAKNLMCGDVIIHDRDVYTLNKNSFWVDCQDLVGLSITLAGSYNKVTIHVDPEAEYDTVEAAQ